MPAQALGAPHPARPVIGEVHGASRLEFRSAGRGRGAARSPARRARDGRGINLDREGRPRPARRGWVSPIAPRSVPSRRRAPPSTSRKARAPFGLGKPMASNGRRRWRGARRGRARPSRRRSRRASITSTAEARLRAGGRRAPRGRQRRAQHTGPDQEAAIISSASAAPPSCPVRDRRRGAAR